MARSHQKRVRVRVVFGIPFVAMHIQCGHNNRISQVQNHCVGFGHRKHANALGVAGPQDCMVGRPALPFVLWLTPQTPVHPLCRSLLQTDMNPTLFRKDCI